MKEWKGGEKKMTKGEKVFFRWVGWPFISWTPFIAMSLMIYERVKDAGLPTDADGWGMIIGPLVFSLIWFFLSGGFIFPWNDKF